MPVIGRYDDDLTDVAGNTVLNGQRLVTSVLVRKPDGTAATLYTAEDGLTAAANPVDYVPAGPGQTGLDALGNFVFHASTEAPGPLYDIVATSGGVAQAPKRVRVSGGTAGGGGGVSDHGALTGLGDADHPVSAVVGLQGALDAKETPAGAQAKVDTEAAARIAADALLVPLAQRGAADGVATLGVDSKVPTAQLPAIAISDYLGAVGSQAAMLALVGQRGDWATRTDLASTFILAGDDPTVLANWVPLPTPADAVLSVDGAAGVVVLASDGAAGTATKRSLGAGASQAAAGNDARIIGAQQTSQKDQANGYPGLNANGFVIPARLGADPSAAKVLHGNGTWAVPAATGIDPALFDAAGDLIVGSGPDAPARLPVGAAKRVLRVNAAANGLEYVDPLSCVIAESGVDASAVNTVAETVVADLTLPGGYVAAGDLVRLVLRGEALNNSGAAVTYTYRVKIGATTVVGSLATSTATNANRRKVYVMVDIHCVSTAAQRMGVFITANLGAAVDLAVIAAGQCFIGYGAATENTATDKQIQFTVQMGTAHALADFIARSATLEVTRKR